MCVSVKLKDEIPPRRYVVLDSHIAHELIEREMNSPNIKYRRRRNPKNPRPDFGEGILHKFIYYTGLRGGKLQRIYRLELDARYYGEYYKDEHSLSLIFNKVGHGR